jgi:hypothetical protein
LVDNTSLVGAFNSAASAKTLADGEYGVGTTVASGAVDTLGEVALTASDIITPQAFGSYLADGTVQKQIASWANNGGATPLVVLAAGGRTLFLNAAATWPNSAAAADFTFTGVITIRWRAIS